MTHEERHFQLSSIKKEVQAIYSVEILPEEKLTSFGDAMACTPVSHPKLVEVGLFVLESV